MLVLQIGPLLIQVNAFRYRIIINNHPRSVSRPDPLAGCRRMPHEVSSPGAMLVTDVRPVGNFNLLQPTG
jgi:hypothetical protein